MRVGKGIGGNVDESGAGKYDNGSVAIICDQVNAEAVELGEESWGRQGLLFHFNGGNQNYDLLKH